MTKWIGHIDADENEQKKKDPKFKSGRTKLEYDNIFQRINTELFYLFIPDVPSSMVCI